MVENAPMGGRVSPAPTGVSVSLPLVVVVAAVLLSLAVLFSGASARGDHSSRSLGPDGSAAFFAILEQLAAPVHHLGVGLLPLRFEAPGSVLFMPIASGASGLSSVSSQETDMLVRFVEQGSSLVLLLDHHTGILSSFGLEVVPQGRRAPDAGGGLAPFQDALPVFLTETSYLGTLGLEGEAWVVPSADDSVLFGAEGYPVVVETEVGAGRVLLISDPTTLSNRGLERGANLEFYVRYVERWLGPEGRVLVDDLHAGAASERGIIAYARKAGLLPMLLLVALIAALYLWRASVRVETVSTKAERPAVHSETDGLAATAGLYERAGLYRYGISVSFRRFRLLLDQRSGQDWGSPGLREWVEREWGAEAALQYEEIRSGLTVLLGQDRPEPRACRASAFTIFRFEEQYLQRRSPRDRHE